MAFLKQLADKYKINQKDGGIDESDEDDSDSDDDISASGSKTK
jgi:hypothetical protein